jgi:hypothetical protein
MPTSYASVHPPVEQHIQPITANPARIYATVAGSPPAARWLGPGLRRDDESFATAEKTCGQRNRAGRLVCRASMTDNVRL